MIIPWKELPPELRIPELKPYYVKLYKKRGGLLIKRGFDLFAAGTLLLLISPLMAGIAIWIKTDSRGPVFFRQERVTQYGKKFRIFKFRTMVADAESKGTLITVDGDSRITRVGQKIRSCRLDELPQLFNILRGEMTFVGTRPEVPKYVERYLPEWRATLLLPAGVTSTASVEYRNEDDVMRKLQEDGLSVDEAYLEHVLPEKMKYNLKEVERFSLIREAATMIRTVFAVLK